MPSGLEPNPSEFKRRASEKNYKERELIIF